MNYYRGQEGAPFHLSIGAVVLNKENKIACLHYHENEHGQPGELYTLMRETVEQNETIEETLKRGCKEELGLKVAVKDFVGPIISYFNYGNKKVEKTTLYFVCEYEEDVEKLSDDWEATGKLEWHDASFLAEKSKEQAIHFDRSDYDESKVLGWLIN